MKKIIEDKILDKKPHLQILNTLIQHSPHGLTLHELTYLLTNKENMYEIDLLKKRLGRSRNNIFKTRQRIQDCLTDLKLLDMIYKKGKKYRLNLMKIKELYLHVSFYNQLEELEEELSKQYENFKYYINNINDKEEKEFEEEFWEHNKKDFLKQYLP